HLIKNTGIGVLALTSLTACSGDVHHSPKLQPPPQYISGIVKGESIATYSIGTNKYTFSLQTPSGPKLVSCIFSDTDSAGMDALLNPGDLVKLKLDPPWQKPEEGHFTYTFSSCMEKLVEVNGHPVVF
ncbi:hypothetical protein HYS50_03325, partial [Candidatus Woesearchaeota archaeon]|nr:hypothetical protein [Candidatus Woesearchaeota archaeon]